MGVVIEVFTGKDGLIRSALVWVGKSFFKRLVQGLHRLEVKQRYPESNVIAEDCTMDVVGDLTQQDPPFGR